MNLLTAPRNFLWLVLILYQLLQIQPANADMYGEATARVYARVEAHVAVTAVEAEVNLGNFQTGDLSGYVTFRVESNVDGIGIWASASNLYKGGTLNTKNVSLLQVLETAGAFIDPERAAPMGGANRMAAYVGVDIINGLPGRMTERIHFQSSQKARFSQDVNLGIAWTQSDAVQPQGQYSGWVKMYCLIMD